MRPVRLRFALAKGLPVRFAAPAGLYEVKLRFTQAARKSLRKKRSAAVKVTVTHAPANGGKRQTASAIRTLKR